MESVGSVLKSVPYIGNVRGSVEIFQNIQIFSGAGEGLDKIKSKNWAEPLGIGLQVTGEIFELAGEAGLPVIGLIGNFFSF